MMRARARQKSRINRAFAQEWLSAYERLQGTTALPISCGPSTALTRPRTAIQDDHHALQACQTSGSPYDFACDSFGTCIGDASLIDLTRFTQ
jgi:hypothetical protein